MYFKFLINIFITFELCNYVHTTYTLLAKYSNKTADDCVLMHYVTTCVFTDINYFLKVTQLKIYIQTQNLAAIIL